MGQKFDMGSNTLTTLTKQTGSANQDLGALVKRLIEAARPLEGRFNGAGKAAWDSFKARGDQIAADLNGALSAINTGQSGMNTAFIEGETEQADNATRLQSTANFDAARFSARA
jgi:uncharacterized protein YukE